MASILTKTFLFYPERLVAKMRQMYFENTICRYLKEEIFPQLAPPPYGEIEMIKLGAQKPVCLFFERTRNIMVVGKLFKSGVVSLDEAWLQADREYCNLKLLRDELGMDVDRDRVVAPLGENKELSALLVTEKAPGRTLDSYIAEAIFEHKRDELFESLSYLARFLFKLYEGGKTESPLSTDPAQSYLDTLLEVLSEGPLDPATRSTVEKYAAKWWNEKQILTSDKEVIVHGDATPTNFLFESGNVMAVDLESMKWGDRCWDLGFIAAELKHNFMWRGNSGWAAEPFIGHFLWQYSIDCTDKEFFYVITRKLPLYMALGLLRIARNLYVGDTHRMGLIMEAEKCLKYGL